MGTNYSLVGPRAEAAVDEGLADAAWFMPPVDPDRLAELQQRTNGRALVDVIIWVVLLVGLGAAAVVLWPSPWAAAALIPYAALYGGAGDSRWHEMGHNTAFRSGRLNDLVYGFASFLLLREPTLWRWSHDRHHTDTLIVGRDLEIAFKRPTSRLEVVKAFAGFGVWPLVRRILAHAAGRRDPEAASFIPEDQWGRVRREARVFTIIMVAMLAWSLWSWSLLPVLMVIGPTVYGQWLMVFFGITQHAGLREDVLDHRLNTRTVYMNPVFRFLYLNMNYHIEHHLFPTVPYYNLPALHREIRPYLPEPLPSTAAAYRELAGALAAQRRDPTWELDRPVPDVADADHRPVTIAGNGPVVVEMGPGGRVTISVVGLAVGRVRRVDVGAHSLAVFRLGDDEYVVTDGFCTHGQAHLSAGAVIDCAVIECPKHNGRFDIRSGEPARRPVTKPLTVHPATFDPARSLLTIEDLR